MVLHVRLQEVCHGLRAKNQPRVIVLQVSAKFRVRHSGYTAGTDIQLNHHYPLD